MESAEISIRRLEVSDATALYEAVRESLDTLGPWMPWCHRDYAPEESEQWVEKQIAAFNAGDEYTFAILRNSEHFAGICGLNSIDRVNHRANLGYWIRASMTGKGMATAAASLLAAWAFNATDLNRLEIVASVDNLASIRVAERCGAKREGTLRQRLVLHGKAHDAAVLSLTREDLTR